MSFGWQEARARELVAERLDEARRARLARPAGVGASDAGSVGTLVEARILIASAFGVFIGWFVAR